MNDVIEVSKKRGLTKKRGEFKKMPGVVRPFVDWHLIRGIVAILLVASWHRNLRYHLVDHWALSIHRRFVYVSYF